ncbi:hypothetical protein ACJZ2D_013102 [Fusarium nematophilum]
MKLSSATALAMFGLAAATPVRSHKRMNRIAKRQVPQEQSHGFVLTITREFLNVDNPKNIVDPVFGLLGNAAAADGAGDVENLDCLKQETADQTFTNAKAAGDLRGMAGALLLQAIERNTQGVGTKSVLCNETAVNAEIGALTQHQDPASEGAGALNKAITLELARQLASLGADPKLALLSGTFPPGDPNDNTGAGNTCDTEDPELGCIYTEGLLVLDASEQEVDDAVADVEQTFTGTGGIFATDLVDLASFDVAEVTGSVDLATIVNGAAAGTGADEAPAATEADEAAAVTEAPAAEDTAAAADGAGCNAEPELTGTLDEFTGDLGGPPPPVESSAGDRPFSVNGNTFTGADAALSRSCDIQHNACANAANSGELEGGVQQCEDQLAECKAANA